jgi:hypothetical protein
MYVCICVVLVGLNWEPLFRCPDLWSYWLSSYQKKQQQKLSNQLSQTIPHVFQSSMVSIVACGRGYRNPLWSWFYCHFLIDYWCSRITKHFSTLFQPRTSRSSIEPARKCYYFIHCRINCHGVFRLGAHCIYFSIFRLSCFECWTWNLVSVQENEEVSESHCPVMQG